jgi:hypothetical protein
VVGLVNQIDRAFTYSCWMRRSIEPSGPWRDPRAGVRVAVAASLGIVGGIAVFFFTFWQAATLIGWDVGAVFSSRGSGGRLVVSTPTDARAMP